MAADVSGAKKDLPVDPAGNDVENTADSVVSSGAAPGGKLSRRKMMLLAGAAALLLALAGGGAFFLLSSGAEEEVPSDVALAGEEMAGGVFLDVLDVTVNLNATGRQAHFLKMSLSIEVGSDADKALLEKQLPRVIDQFQVYLRELRIEELSGSSGIYRLREELLERVRSVAGGIPVKDVLFREILVQ